MGDNGSPPSLARHRELAEAPAPATDDRSLDRGRMTVAQLGASPCLSPAPHQEPSTMDILQALRFPFADRRNAGSLLVAFLVAVAGCAPFAAWDGAAGFPGALLIAIAILAAVVGSGYGMRITRRVAEGESTLLPPWGNWRGLLVDGLRFFVVFSAWVLLLSLIAGFVSVGLLLAFGAGTATTWLDPNAAWRGPLFLLPANLLLVPSLARTAVAESIDEGLRVPTIIGVVRRNLRLYALAAFAIAVFDLARVGLDAGLATLDGDSGTLPGLFRGATLTLASGLFASHVYGQAYRRSQAPDRPAPPLGRPIAAAP